MDCRILRSLTLKSDGHLCCDDSSGYGLHLGEVSAKPSWSLREVLQGPVWTHIRNSFRQGKVPWPGTCEGCDLLSPGAPPTDTFDTTIEVRIEPTLSCELRCPCCTRQHEAKRRMGSWFLDPKIFENLLKNCIRHGIDVSRIVYLGLGEPLEHPNFAELCNLATKITPNAIQELGTNGNPPFLETVRDSRLDRIIVAGDGVRQSSYEKYRIRGSVSCALQFMRDARKHATNNPFIEWKYILFEFNDSDEELIEAQRMAEEIGVDSIMFIVTPSKWHSKRFRSENLNEFPCVSPIATVSPAAGLQKVQQTGQPQSRLTNMGRREKAICFVDSCVMLTCGVLRVEGWALDAQGNYVDRVDLYVNGHQIGRCRTAHARKDVPLAIPDAEGPMCAFIFQYPFKPDWLRRAQRGEILDLDLDVHTQRGSERFYCTYRFPGGWSAGPLHDEGTILVSGARQNLVTITASRR
jgi:molybdenum cofactor biosynthesis enzyme MoaA